MRYKACTTSCVTIPYFHPDNSSLQIDVSLLCVCPLNDDKLYHNIVAVEPRATGEYKIEEKKINWDLFKLTVEWEMAKNLADTSDSNTPIWPSLLMLLTGAITIGLPVVLK